MIEIIGWFTSYPSPDQKRNNMVLQAEERH
jgi:hypothetical protein